MEVVVNVEGAICFLLGWKPPDDKATVIGLSMVAYVSENDPAHIFLPAAILHDARSVKGSPFQLEGHSRLEADTRFLTEMLEIANFTYQNDEKKRFKLECEAVTLFLLVRKYGAATWEGRQYKEEI